MSSRIAIRRTGCFLPTLCLAAIVVFFCLIGWLCIIGLPDAALRAAERKVEEQTGLHLHIGSLKLNPAMGLSVRAGRVKVEAPAPGLPELQVRRLSLSCSWDVLFGGTPSQAEVTVKDAMLTQPVVLKEGAELCVKDFGGKVGYSLRNGIPVAEASLTADVQGVQTIFNARVPLEQDLLPAASAPADAAPAEPREPLDYAAVAEQIAPTVLQVYEEFARQHWTVPPRIRLGLAVDDRTGKPLLDRLRVALRATLPSYEVEEFHFRDAAAEAEMKDGIILINKLTYRTVDPETEVSFKGGYDIVARTVDFDITSSASLVRLADEFWEEDDNGILHKIRHAEDDTPEIKLNGSVTLTEDFEAAHLRFLGSVDQKAFTVGATPLQHAHIGFFYEDGNFNLNEVSLTLPDGTVRFNALAKDGEGEAELQVDAPVAYLLALANEFAPVTLPEGLELRDRLKLNLSAALDTVVLRPGETSWESLIPKLRALKAEAALGGLTVQGVRVEQPALELTADGVGLQQHTLRALEVVLKAAATEAEDGTVQGAELRLNAHDLCYDEQTESVRTADAKAELTVAASAHADMAARAVRVQAELPRGWDSAADWHTRLAGAAAELTAEELKQGEDFAVTALQLQAAMESAEQGRADFTAVVGDKPAELHLPAVTLAEQGSRILLKGAAVQLPVAAFAPLLESADVQIADIRLPELVTADAVEVAVDAAQGKLLAAKAHINVPELVRTPNAVPVFRGAEIPVAVETTLSFTPNEAGELLYEGPLAIRHSSGALEARVQGNLARRVHVVGRSTIAVDVIDRLIDDADAHAIMRDFRFKDKSRVALDNLDATVSYDNGVCVDVTSKADIAYVDYKIGIIDDEKDADGTAVREFLHRDWNQDAYVSFNRLQCGVGVQVYLNRKGADGTPVPDVQQVLLTDPVLVCDNSTWFRLRGIKGGKRETTIKGRSVQFDLDNSCLYLNGLKGEAYPAYAFSAFYDPLRDFLKDLHHDAPVTLESEQCVFPLSLTTKVPMKGLIRVNAAKAGFDFIGTTIPLQAFSGFVNISDKAVLLDRMNARSWQGVLNAAVEIGFGGQHTTFDGYAEAEAMDLSAIAKSYGTDFPYALAHANIRFQAPSADIKALRAYGNFSLEDGDLMQLKIFSPVSDLISNLPQHLFDLEQKVKGSVGMATKDEPGFFTRSMTWLFSATGNTMGRVGRRTSAVTDYVPFLDHILSYNIQDTAGSFDIRNGHLYSRDMTAWGENVDVEMFLNLDLDSLTLKGNIWPHIGSVPGALISTVSVLSANRLNIHLYGGIKDIKWGLGLDKKKSAEPDSLSEEPIHPAPQTKARR